MRFNVEMEVVHNKCYTYAKLSKGGKSMNVKERKQYYSIGNELKDAAHMEYLSEHKPKYLYQYKAINDRNLENLLNQQIWLSLPLYLNDPFEQEYGIYREGALISCFTENYNSLLMWSHYSNSHQGYCVKYNFDDISNYFKSNLFPVLYSSERFKPSIKESGNANAVINTFIHKASEWKYEKEWRVIKLTPINKQKLTEVNINQGERAETPKPIEMILGCHCWDWDKEQIIVKYCKENNIVLSKMRMKDTKYKLYKNILPFNLFDPPEINLDKYMEEYLKTDDAKKDLKMVIKQNEEAEKQRYINMKDFLYDISLDTNLKC